MQEIYPYKELNWYPHLGEYEQGMWGSFVKTYPDKYERAMYDVKVGPTAEFDTIVNRETGGSVAALYQKKIDVVGLKGDDVDIIEVKRNAGSSAVAQLLQYKHFYTKDFKPTKEPNMILLTNNIREGLLDFALSQGVQIVII